MFALSVSVTVMPVSTASGTFSVCAVVPPLAARTGATVGAPVIETSSSQKVVWMLPSSSERNRRLTVWPAYADRSSVRSTYDAPALESDVLLQVTPLTWTLKKSNGWLVSDVVTRR